MLDHWRDGIDVVYAVREERDGESRFKLTTARWFYSLFDKLAQVECARTPATSDCSIGALWTRCSRCASATASCAG